MSLHNFILKDGKPVPEPDIRAWGRWFETSLAERVVAKTTVGDSHVSTVFLGTDHNFSAAGEPILWETMIFGGPHADYQCRYASRERAEAGHVSIVAALQAGRPSEDQDQ